MPKRLLFVFALLLLAPVPPASAQDSRGAQDSTSAVSAEDRGAIQGVIQNQLAAFRRDDGVEAFSYASPGIRARFQTVENFMSMVRDGYPAVYRPRQVEMLDLKVRGSTVQQEVLFVGPDGGVVKAVYSMEPQEDGTWRIGSVYLLPLEESAT